MASSVLEQPSATRERAPGVYEVTTASLSSGTAAEMRRAATASLAYGFALLLGWRAYTTLRPGVWPTTALSLAVGSIVLVALGSLALTRSVAAGSASRRVLVGPIWILYFTLAFGVTALGWSHRAPLDAPNVHPEFIVLAVLLSGGAIASWTLGYLLRPSRSWLRFFEAALGGIPGLSPTLRWRNIAVVLYLLGVAARLIRLDAGQFAYLQDVNAALTSPSGRDQLLGLVERLAVLGLIIAALDAFLFSRSLRSRLVVAVLFMSEIAFGMFAASKESVLLAVLSVALVYRSSVNRRLPRLAVFVFLVLIIAVFSFNSTYRSAIRSTPGGHSVSASVALDALPRALGNMLDQPPSRLGTESFQLAAARVRQVDNTALVLERTPSRFSFRSWPELVTGPLLGLIPRVFWPSKPVLSTGYEFSRYYRDIPAGVYTANGVSTHGDLFRHGGLAPMVLGMLLLGLLVRVLDDVFGRPGDVRRLVVVIPLIAPLIYSESDVTSLIVLLAKSLLLAAITVRVAFVNSQRVAE